MLQFIVRRLLQLIPVLIGVTILVFSLMHLTPGNPAHIIAGENAPKETVEQIEERLGLNDPIVVQYVDFVKNAVKLDFGNSWRTSLPVTQKLWPKFWISEEHTSELLSRFDLVCRLLLEKKKCYSSMTV